MAGGLMATFVSAYLHTIIIYVMLVIFSITVYVTNSTLGSPARVSSFSPHVAQVATCLDPTEILS